MAGGRVLGCARKLNAGNEEKLRPVTNVALFQTLRRHRSSGKVVVMPVQRTSTYLSTEEVAQIFGILGSYRDSLVQPMAPQDIIFSNSRQPAAEISTGWVASVADAALVTNRTAGSARAVRV